MSFLKTLTILILLASSLHAQRTPAIEWRVSTNSPGGLAGKQTQDQSGEEWWYSHKNVRDASGKTIQYVNVGYTGLVSTAATFTAAQNLYNEGTDSPYNPIISGSPYWDYNTLPEGCEEGDYIGEHRTPVRGNIGMTALDGTMMYCKPKTIGALEEVIQDPTELSSFYVVGVHKGVRPYKNKTSFIPYNKTNAEPANYFSLSAMGVSNYTNDIGHLYVAKIDIGGSVIWEGIYGYLDYSASPINAYGTFGYGYSIIKNSAGHLVALGFAQQDSGKTSPGFPFLIELDPSNGSLINKKILPVNNFGILPTTHSLTGIGAGGIGHSLVELKTPNNYAVGVTYYYGNTTLDDNNNAYVWGLNTNFDPLTSWNMNPIKIAGNGSPTYNSGVWEMKYHQKLDQILVTVVGECTNCASAGKSAGNGYVYRLNNDGTFAVDGTNPSSLGNVNAFDLRVGAEETSDGGFVAVSSTRPSEADHTPPSADQLWDLNMCPPPDITSWDTDALIVKFNSSGEKVWSKTFDKAEGRQRESFPGDLKRQECMYRISEADDGGYVISGNSSGNFDDNYMAKLYPECNSQQTFTNGTDYVIDITEDVTWNKTVNVLGKIIVHPGVVFTISGPGIRISFADSKFTGVETGLTIMDGGWLRLTGGAVLSEMTNCKGSSWNGVEEKSRIAPDNTFLLYPDPAIDHFNLEYRSQQETEVIYSITDMTGRELMNGKMDLTLANEISSERLSTGLYIVSLVKDKKIIGQQKLSIIK